MIVTFYQEVLVLEYYRASRPGGDAHEALLPAAAPGDRRPGLDRRRRPLPPLAGVEVLGGEGEPVPALVDELVDEVLGLQLQRRGRLQPLGVEDGVAVRLGHRERPLQLVVSAYSCSRDSP